MADFETVRIAWTPSPTAAMSDTDELAQQPAQSSHRVRVRRRRAATEKSEASDADNTAVTSDRSPSRSLRCVRLRGS